MLVQTNSVIISTVSLIISFIFADNQDNPDLKIKISAKRIKHVQAHLLRGCPVIWFLIDAHSAAQIRADCKLTDATDAYFDPDSPGTCKICIFNINSCFCCCCTNVLKPVFKSTL